MENFLVAGFTTGLRNSDLDTGLAVDADNAGCYTNCTATLSNSDGCGVSLFLLESVDARIVSNPGSYGIQIPEECGTYSFVCCNQTIPAECLGRGKSQTTLNTCP